MVAALLVAAFDAGPVALGVGVTAVMGFAGLLVRQSLLSSKLTSDQSDKWQVMVAAVERRAELAEKRADSCETRAAAAEHKATVAEGRADLLDLQLDEVRKQLESLRQQVAASDLMPKRETP